MDLSYKKAYEEMEEILRQIENEELDIDQLSKSVQRVNELHKHCTHKLRKTQEEVEKIIEDMDTGGESDEAQQ